MNNQVLESIKSRMNPYLESEKVFPENPAPPTFNVFDEYKLFDEENFSLVEDDAVWLKECDCVGNCLHEINWFMNKNRLENQSNELQTAL